MLTSRFGVPAGPHRGHQESHQGARRRCTIGTPPIRLTLHRPPLAWGDHPQTPPPDVTPVLWCVRHTFTPSFDGSSLPCCGLGYVHEVVIHEGTGAGSENRSAYSPVNTWYWRCQPFVYPPCSCPLGFRKELIQTLSSPDGDSSDTCRSSWSSRKMSESRVAAVPPAFRT